MSANSEYMNRILSAIPESVKNAAGLSKRISDHVNHIVSMEFQHVCWHGAHQTLLSISYLDGFQLWRFVESEDPYEILSLRDNPVGCLRVLDTPEVVRRTEGHAVSRGLSSSCSSKNIRDFHPFVALVHLNNASVVNLYSLVHNKIVYVLRMPQSITRLDGGSGLLAVVMHGKICLYSSETFESLYVCETAPVPSPPLAIGPRWLAYAAPPSMLVLPSSSQGPSSSSSASTGGQGARGSFSFPVSPPNQQQHQQASRGRTKAGAAAASGGPRGQGQNQQGGRLDGSPPSGVAGGSPRLNLHGGQQAQQQRGGGRTQLHFQGAGASDSFSSVYSSASQHSQTRGAGSSSLMAHSPAVSPQALAATLDALWSLGVRTLDSLLVFAPAVLQHAQNPRQTLAAASSSLAARLEAAAAAVVGVDQSAASSCVGCGGAQAIMVREKMTGNLVAVFDPGFSAPVSLLRFHPTGLLLFSCSFTGQVVQGHKVMPSSSPAAAALASPAGLQNMNVIGGGMGGGGRGGNSCEDDEDWRRRGGWGGWTGGGALRGSGGGGAGGLRGQAGGCSGGSGIGIEFVHVCSLNRGMLPASISDVSFSQDGRLAAVCSSKGTAHLFALPHGLGLPCPPTSARSLLPLPLHDGTSLSPLALFAPPPPSLAALHGESTCADLGSGVGGACAFLQTLEGVGRFSPSPSPALSPPQAHCFRGPSPPSGGGSGGTSLLTHASATRPPLAVLPSPRHTHNPAASPQFLTAPSPSPRSHSGQGGGPSCSQTTVGVGGRGGVEWISSGTGTGGGSVGGGGSSFISRSAPSPLSLAPLARIRLGSALLQEALSPRLVFLKSGGRCAPSVAHPQPVSVMAVVATRAGSAHFHNLLVSPLHGPGGTQAQASDAGGGSGHGQQGPQGGMGMQGQQKQQGVRRGVPLGGLSLSELEISSTAAGIMNVCRTHRNFPEIRTHTQLLAALTGAAAASMPQPQQPSLACIPPLAPSPCLMQGASSPAASPLAGRSAGVVRRSSSFSSIAASTAAAAAASPRKSCKLPPSPLSISSSCQGGTAETVAPTQFSSVSSCAATTTFSVCASPRGSARPLASVASPYAAGARTPVENFAGGDGDSVRGVWGGLEEEDGMRLEKGVGGRGGEASEEREGGREREGGSYYQGGTHTHSGGYSRSGGGTSSSSSGGQLVSAERHAKWVAQAEIVTCYRTEPARWLCPTIRFFTFSHSPSATSRGNPRNALVPTRGGRGRGTEIHRARSKSTSVSVSVPGLPGARSSAGEGEKSGVGRSKSAETAAANARLRRGILPPHMEAVVVRQTLSAASGTVVQTPSVSFSNSAGGAGGAGSETAAATHGFQPSGLLAGAISTPLTSPPSSPFHPNANTPLGSRRGPTSGEVGPSSSSSGSAAGFGFVLEEDELDRFRLDDLQEDLAGASVEDPLFFCMVAQESSSSSSSSAQMDAEEPTPPLPRKNSESQTSNAHLPPRPPGRPSAASPHGGHGGGSTSRVPGGGGRVAAAAGMPRSRSVSSSSSIGSGGGSGACTGVGAVARTQGVGVGGNGSTATPLQKQQQQQQPCSSSSAKPSSLSSFPAVSSSLSFASSLVRGIGGSGGGGGSGGMGAPSSGVCVPLQERLGLGRALSFFRSASSSKGAEHENVGGDKGGDLNLNTAEEKDAPGLVGGEFVEGGFEALGFQWSGLSGEGVSSSSSSESREGVGRVTSEAETVRALSSSAVQQQQQQQQQQKGLSQPEEGGESSRSLTNSLSLGEADRDGEGFASACGGNGDGEGDEMEERSPFSVSAEAPSNSPGNGPSSQPPLISPLFAAFPEHHQRQNQKEEQFRGGLHEDRGTETGEGLRGVIEEESGARVGEECVGGVALERDSKEKTTIGTRGGKEEEDDEDVVSNSSDGFEIVF
uniref:BCAS3 WD40 domain-containing protein n=1 Tax=Chromera velia CCMP2878 TaxID=1169474 RepID=A0A0G4GN38_9ALVE|eukprot:Cvel_22631.t1-p1 / transcript=Cvel_22631.t1 / gene=Cvel_22631 / organism=Chromera_velia_CCMP2878 / gene_product=Breast carcinoma-amplified sequence 3 homolog, putative / transcript_product=Breast carcinoma-amplified sequence 3 homolog, putative / location=Cvel_scaffold2244:20974-27996(-) / protein_length=1896 / sequence_SO=supercontig / SO=protein_coding / is_pseudo=false